MEQHVDRENLGRGFEAPCPAKNHTGCRRRLQRKNCHRLESPKDLDVKTARYFAARGGILEFGVAGIEQVLP